MVENVERIMQLYAENGNKSETSRLICKELGIPITDNVRRNITKIISKRVDKVQKYDLPCHQIKDGLKFIVLVRLSNYRKGG